MEDLVTQLKNFNKKYTFPCFYSGFVKVDEASNSNLYYWFFRDEKYDANAPLVLWLNGGPGASSQLGNLIENGPIRLVKDKNGNINAHSLTGQAWNSIANVIYLDQPVGVGFSYGNLKISEVSQVQSNFLSFMKGFYEKHPEMKGRDFFITGESYGGKFEPAMASAIIDYNQNALEADKIPLKGVLIGNGYVDPMTQRLSIRHLSLALGSIQLDSLPELDTMEQK
jgi:carboxypeptidase C (cathepsin A)